MCKATEIVTMKTVEEVTTDEFIAIVANLEEAFHSQQPGFIDSELLFNEKADEWIMIQHWDTLENMHAASKRMFNNDLTEAFVRCLDPKSVKMLMLPQLSVWDRKTEAKES